MTMTAGSWTHSSSSPSDSGGESSYTIGVAGGSGGQNWSENASDDQITVNGAVTSGLYPTVTYSSPIAPDRGVRNVSPSRVFRVRW